MWIQRGVLGLEKGLCLSNIHITAKTKVSQQTIAQGYPGASPPQVSDAHTPRHPQDVEDSMIHQSRPPVSSFNVMTDWSVQQMYKFFINDSLICTELWMWFLLKNKKLSKVFVAFLRTEKKFCALRCKLTFRLHFQFGMSH